ncbi:Usher syndrome type-1C protein-binding protein 1 [Python bivittatus]|uniref:Usher syndrome type-1C protein-binding protein 1 n=1 Tax=Python bivittatus TaxID=176946 RepID=A0A9F5J132_PYTBI|nr:Usher syndrome type-1C protein-binding protein 1 [Python bivittatus]
MEKQEGEPPGTEDQEEESGEEALLHYEERITELLVTIARLQGKIERLQQNKAREEENFSDLGSESTASLPRCPSLFASRTRSPPPPPAGPEEGKADLFLDVHKAVTSLENVVLSYRSCLPSTEAELEGYPRVAEGLEAKLMKLQPGSLRPLRQEAPAPAHERTVALCAGGDEWTNLPPRGLLPSPGGPRTPAYERTVALYKERNAALRAELGAKEEALRRSGASLSAYQEERSKLQRKVQQLQSSLSRVEIRSDGAPRPLGDPSGAAQNGLRAPQGATSIQPACTLSASAPTETHSTLEQLHRIGCSKEYAGYKLEPQKCKRRHSVTRTVCPPRSVERLGRLNRLLSGALQESKTAAERISLLLGRQESDHTALALAARCSTALLEDPLPVSRRGQRPLAGPSPNGHNSLPCLEVRARALGLTLPPGHLLAGGPNRSSPALDTAYRFLQACSTASKSSREQDGIRESSLELLGLEEEAKARLRECIRRLRADQGSLKLPAPQPPPGLDSVAARLNAGIGAKVAEGRRAMQEALPGPDPQPKVEKAQLLRELHAARASIASSGGPPERLFHPLSCSPRASRAGRLCAPFLSLHRFPPFAPTQEALADLGTQLHLTVKEKQGLELGTHTLQAQEAACLLVIQTLQQEQQDLRGQPAPSSGSSSSGSSSGERAPVGASRRSPPAASENADGSLGKTEPKASMLALLDTSARIRRLQDRLEALLADLEGGSRGWKAREAQEMELLWDFFQAHSADLEERSRDCKAREAQEMELLWDFFQAHSALLLAYQKARRKQESQVGKLEAQMGLMSGHQAKQRQALMRTLRQLQDRVPVGAPTGLPQAPVLDMRMLDPPGSLEATSFFTEEKVRLSGHTQTRLQASQEASPMVISH